MTDEPKDETELLEHYRAYLHVLAQLQVDRRLHGRIDLSGVVQQTLLEAHQALPGMRELSVECLAVWLRKVLANNLTDEIRKLKTAKRDVRRERSLDDALDQSTQRVQAWLAADDASPSGHAQVREQTLQLSAALARLPEAQREALMLRNFQGWTLDQISQHTGRSQSAVAGLLKRGLQKLRDQLYDGT